MTGGTGNNYDLDLLIQVRTPLLYFLQTTRYYLDSFRKLLTRKYTSLSRMSEKGGTLSPRYVIGMQLRTPLNVNALSSCLSRLPASPRCRSSSKHVPHVHGRGPHRHQQ